MGTLCRLGTAACLGVTSPTRAAPAQLPVPAHYDLSARIDRTAATIAARVVIDLPPDQTRMESRFILAKRFTIDSAAAGPDASVEVEPTDKPIPGLQAVTIRAAAGRPAPRRIFIAWGGPLNPPKESSPVVAVSADRVELFVDVLWLPLRDDFGLRYTIDAEVSGLAPDMAVASQGEIQRVGNREMIHRAMPDFDFALVAERGLNMTAAGDVEIYACDLLSPYAMLYRRYALGSIAYYEKWFGRLPTKPVRLVVVGRSSGPGYARRGYIVVTERGPTDEPDERQTAGFIAHELGHAWWSAGAPTTEDYWMTESLASYVSSRYVESIGYPTTDEELTKMRDASRTIGPILGHGRPSGPAVYTKGLLLLMDLEARIGRPAMDRIIGELAPHAPDKTAVFLQKVADVAGADAARAFEAALRRDGYDR